MTKTYYLIGECQPPKDYSYEVIRVKEIPTISYTYRELG